MIRKRSELWTVTGHDSIDYHVQEKEGRYMSLAFSPEYIKWVAEMKQALDKQVRVRKSNLPFIMENKLIRAQNVEAFAAHARNGNKSRSFKGKPYKRLRLLPAGTRRILERESARRTANQKIAPEEWLHRVESIKSEPIRLVTASIIWWDYFAQRLWCDRWPHLDVYIDKRNKVFPPDRTIAIYLFRCGYSPYTAKCRARTPKFVLEREQMASELRNNSYVDEDHRDN